MSDQPLPSPTSTSKSSSNLEPAQIEGGLTNEPNSITHLFSIKQPLEWNEEDMKRIVAYNRKARAEMELETVKKKGTAAKIPKEDLKDVSGDELLGKLGLDL